MTKPKKFYDDCLVPEIADPRVSRKEKPHNPQDRIDAKNAAEIRREENAKKKFTSNKSIAKFSSENCTRREGETHFDSETESTEESQKQNANNMDYSDSETVRADEFKVFSDSETENECNSGSDGCGDLQREDQEVNK